MLMRLMLVILGAALLVIGGCANVAVYAPDDTEQHTIGQLKGIPFYVKVPVLTQDTKLVVSELLVQIEVAETTGSTTSQTAHYPASGQLRMSINDRPLIDKVIAEIYDNAKGQTFADASKEVAKGVASLSKGRTANEPPKVLSNSWSLSMVVSPKSYYISNYQPLIGTATTAYEFSADGTLNKASSTITDDTVKTLLGLFPITAKLSQRWGLTTAQTKALGLDQGKPPVVKMDVTVTESKTVYGLRRVSELPANSSVGKYTFPDTARSPLSLQDARDGKNGVQLVSEDVVTADNAGNKKTNAKAYQIEGTITPPKDDTTGAGNTDAVKGAAAK
jgi:hypothetical protein